MCNNLINLFILLIFGTLIIFSSWDWSLSIFLLGAAVLACISGKVLYSPLILDPLSFVKGGPRLQLFGFMAYALQARGL